MVRWEPGARERLQAAALDLYVRQGFEETTAEEIARSAGLTERTFFRHFADKREVLFDGQHLLQQAFLQGVAATPEGASPLAMIASALRASAEFFPVERKEYSRRRQSIIEANPALQERELLKLAGLASAVAAALRSRGITEPAATLAAESGVTVFGVAFRAWVAEGEGRPFVEIEQEALRGLTVMVAGLSTSDGVDQPVGV
jgi:AcrR family transcriptional regulator